MTNSRKSMASSIQPSFAAINARHCSAVIVRYQGAATAASGCGAATRTSNGVRLARPLPDHRPRQRHEHTRVQKLFAQWTIDDVANLLLTRDAVFDDLRQQTLGKAGPPTVSDRVISRTHCNLGERPRPGFQTGVTHVRMQLETCIEASTRALERRADHVRERSEHR